MVWWMVFITVVLGIFAAAASCYPGYERAAGRLAGAACAFMALTALVSLIARPGMFADVRAVPAGLWLQAGLTLAVCALLGVLLAYIAGRSGHKK